jgi:hypothetical protein
MDDSRLQLHADAGCTDPGCARVGNILENYDPSLVRDKDLEQAQNSLVAIAKCLGPSDHWEPRKLILSQISRWLANDPRACLIIMLDVWRRSKRKDKPGHYFLAAMREEIRRRPSS